MFLSVTLYELEGVDHFKVHMVPDDNCNEPIDVTDQYELSAIEDELTGQQGFVVMPKHNQSIADESTRSPTGVEL